MFPEILVQTVGVNRPLLINALNNLIEFRGNCRLGRGFLRFYLRDGYVEPRPFRVNLRHRDAEALRNPSVGDFLGNTRP